MLLTDRTPGSRLKKKTHFIDHFSSIFRKETNARSVEEMESSGKENDIDMRSKAR